MIDFVSKQAAIDVVMEEGKLVPVFAKRCKNAIENLPSVHTDGIVHCCDCIFYSYKYRNCEKWREMFIIWEDYEEMDDSNYCGFAKKKGEQDE